MKKLGILTGVVSIMGASIWGAVWMVWNWQNKFGDYSGMPWHCPILILIAGGLTTYGYLGIMGAFEVTDQ
ncbi:hypothetical protein LCGC14_1207860 [marine sediment metagenome]|uniref:Uncharacterized protein n=1 Tax=marine sediment metagenome TaxID=412755 RepID=A0A0F9PJM3_9ZZZZ|nr:hypothetical protein [Actinomycetota bacterium]